MHFPALFRYAHILWLVFCLYFLAKYRFVRAKRTASVSIFSLERVSLLSAAALAFFPGTHFSVLATPLHRSYALAVLGLVLIFAGLTFAAWARELLGRNWSGRVIIQDHHQLVTAGPYAYIRHPLYTGLLTAIAGTCLMIGDLGALLGFLLAVTFVSLKASREERLLQTEFGTTYTTYRAQTGALLPRLF